MTQQQRIPIMAWVALVSFVFSTPAWAQAPSWDTLRTEQPKSADEAAATSTSRSGLEERQSAQPTILTQLRALLASSTFSSPAPATPAVAHAGLEKPGRLHRAATLSFGLLALLGAPVAPWPSVAQTPPGPPSSAAASPAPLARLTVTIQKLPSGVRLEIRGPADATAYHVDTAAVVTGPWQRAAENLPVDSSGVTRWTHRVGDAQQFYKVVVSSAPGPYREYTRGRDPQGNSLDTVTTFDPVTRRPVQIEARRSMKTPDGLERVERGNVGVAYDSAGRLTLVEAKPIWLEALGHTTAGDGFAAIQKDAAGRLLAIRGMVAFRQLGTTGVWQLQRIGASVNVVLPKGTPFATVDITRDMATTVTEARVTLLPGGGPWGITRSDGTFEAYGVSRASVPELVRNPDGTLIADQGVTRTVAADGTVEYRLPTGLVWRLSPDGGVALHQANGLLEFRWLGTTVEIGALGRAPVAVRASDLIESAAMLLTPFLINNATNAPPSGLEEQPKEDATEIAPALDFDRGTVIATDEQMRALRPNDFVAFRFAEHAQSPIFYYQIVRRHDPALPSQRSLELQEVNLSGELLVKPTKWWLTDTLLNRQPWQAEKPGGKELDFRRVTLAVSTTHEPVEDDLATGLEEPQPATSFITPETRLVPGDRILEYGYGTSQHMVIAVTGYSSNYGIELFQLDPSGMKMLPGTSTAPLRSRLNGGAYVPMPVTLLPSNTPTPLAWPRNANNWAAAIWDTVLPNHVFVLGAGRFYATPAARPKLQEMLSTAGIKADIQEVPTDHNAIPAYSFVAYDAAQDPSVAAATFNPLVATRDIIADPFREADSFVRWLLEQWKFPVKRVLEIRPLPDGSVAIFV